MGDQELRPLPGDWDNPKPCSAPQPEAIDAVAALNQFRDRIPELIDALQQVHKEAPALLLEVLTGDVSPQSWRYLAALCAEPAEILAALALLCQRHADKQAGSAAEWR